MKTSQAKRPNGHTDEATSPLALMNVKVGTRDTLPPRPAREPGCDDDEGNGNEATKPTPFTLKSIGELGWTRDTPPARVGALYITEAGNKRSVFMPAGHPALLIAEGGFGKTQLMLQQAVAVATGGRWLGSASPLEAEEPKAVFFLAAEEPDEELHRRLFHTVRRLGLSSNELELLERNLYPVGLVGTGEPTAFLDVEPTTKKTTRTRLFDHVRATVSAPPKNGGEWGGVFLDPAARLGPPGFELDTSTATAFVQCLEVLCATPDRPFVQLAHHTNKLSRGSGGEPMTANASRGASALTDAMRFVMALGPDTATPPNADALLAVVKSNYTARPKAAFRLERGEHGHLRMLGSNEAPASAPSATDEAKRLAEVVDKVCAVLRRNVKGKTRTELNDALRAKYGKGVRKEDLGTALAQGEAAGRLQQVSGNRWVCANVDNEANAASVQDESESAASVTTDLP